VQRPDAAGPPRAVCLFGPTGTGKTALALALAQELPLEVVSVDSAMVYRHMDIGTAKPTAAERQVVTHHLVDIREPWEAYSAGQFRGDALRAIAGIAARGRLPLLVGGTMLYFRALFRGLARLPVADPALRSRIDAEAAERGWAALHAELARVDPASAARITAGDRQRIQRALEVWRLTGTPLSVLQDRDPEQADGQFLRIAIVPADRSALYRRLDERLAAMARAGFLDEVRRLYQMPLMSAERPAMRAVGYRQIWCHLAGELTQQEAWRQAAVATRRLAKRQLTWLRSERADVALDPATVSVAKLVAVIGRAGVSRPA
jgi:tRNA dimethylallyltransferase